MFHAPLFHKAVDPAFVSGCQKGAIGHYKPMNNSINVHIPINTPCVGMNGEHLAFPAYKQGVPRQDN